MPSARAQLLALPLLLAAAPAGADPFDGRQPVDAYAAMGANSARVVGLGGAFVAVGEGLNGATINPASVANRDRHLERSWALDCAFSFRTPTGGDLVGQDVDNDGATDGALSGNPSAALGLSGQRGKLGVGFLVTQWGVEAPRSGQTERVAAYDLALVTGWSGGLDSWVVGVSLTDTHGEVVAKSGEQALARLGYDALRVRVGGLWKPRGERWRLGAAVATASSARTKGDRSVMPFPTPTAFVFPWSLSVGIAGWVGPNARRYNEPSPAALALAPGQGEPLAWDADRRQPVLLTFQLDSGGPGQGRGQLHLHRGGGGRGGPVRAVAQPGRARRARVGGLAHLAAAAHGRLLRAVPHRRAGPPPRHLRLRGARALLALGRLRGRLRRHGQQLRLLRPHRRLVERSGPGRATVQAAGPARAGPPRAAGRGAVKARVALLTGASLACFAANSLLCRAALRPGLVAPGAFTAVRLASGALALAAVLALTARARPSGGRPGAALALLVYAVAFSLAYVRIGAGVGALLLFGAVQLTMVGWAVLRGARPGRLQLAGLGLALAGLAALALPGASAPDAAGAGLMVLAGAAWGAYSLAARGASAPLAATAGSFALAAPVALALPFLLREPAPASAAGLGLAVASGALASGGGYALWTAAVPALVPTRAAAVQLAVPVLAGVGATAFLGEPLPARVAVAGAAILAGIALTLRR
ncbi:MAG: DMT family transporter [Anaeromyxobacter sp.]